MRRIKNLWFCAVATLAVVGTMSAIGAETAAAVEYPLTGLPEFGRCVPAGAGKGERYRGAKCLRHFASGAYEWLPGPGETKPTYEATLESFRLETVGKKAVVCLGFITGTYKDSKTASVELELKGCVNVLTKARCQGPTPEEGEINAPVSGIEAEIGFLKGGLKPIVGWDIKPKAGQPSPNVLEFTCGNPPETTIEKWTVEGSAIGVLKKINRMTSIFALIYKQSAGKQERTEFEGGPKDTLKAKVSTTVPPSSVEEDAAIGMIGGEKATVEIENGEPFEVKAKSIP